MDHTSGYASYRWRIILDYGYYGDKKARRRCLEGFGVGDGSERLARLNTVSEMEYVASRMKVRMTSTRTGGQALWLTGQQVRTF